MLPNTIQKESNIYQNKEEKSSKRTNQKVRSVGSRENKKSVQKMQNFDYEV
jgi:hypothetical protein